MDKATKILSQIKRYNQSYRSGNAEISDQEYDTLVDELYRIDPENDWFKNVEPVSVNNRRKVKLPIPMKSLNKAKDIKSLLLWAKSIGISENADVVITPKFDGLSLLHDERNNLSYSRGGAENEGMDCTAHYKAAINIVNTESDFQYTFGELLFSCDSWNKNFAGRQSPETGDKYKSPRNTACGLLNRDEPSNNLKHVTFFRYGVDEESMSKFTTYSDLYKSLCETFTQSQLMRTSQIGQLSEELLMDLYTLWSSQYYIDGLVIYVNDLSIWKAVGRQESTGNPNYAIAYKDPNFSSVFETTVKDVSWKVSKSGALKPVVNIEAVDTGDCSMENPTGYNAGWIYDHHIAKGAKILVTRSGGVIPKILKTTEHAPQESEDKLWEDLCICPHCGAETQWNDKQIELMCSNKECCGVRLAKIVFFFKIVEAENMGEETISKIFNAGFDTLSSMLNLTFDDLLGIDGFGESTANQILTEMQKIKDGIEITKLMHASDCFNGIGQTKAKNILSQMSEEHRFAIYNGVFHTWDNNQELMKTTAYQEANITTQSFLLGLVPFYDFVASNGLVILPLKIIEKAQGGKMDGVRVCFTGIRDSGLEETIRLNGGEIASGVTKKTTHLIVADKNTQSSKSLKAQQIGVPILNISEFKDIFGL